MWVTAFAPATMGPSIEEVRKILLPHMIGDECPRPGIAVLHWTFFVWLHSSGRFFSIEMPLPPGPRHCGQLVSSPADVTSAASETGPADKATMKMKVRLKKVLISGAIEPVLLTEVLQESLVSICHRAVSATDRQTK